MKEQEGPYVGMRPAQIYKSCSGCKYHKHTLVKSGNNPDYIDDCIHKEAPPSGQWFVGNLNNYDGVVEPGTWCPFEAVNAIDLD